jgi:guanosine-3',5'-bis(diphosphate) 3'-pyrophosphohydrolase
MSDLAIVTRALDFAARKHVAQRRKGAGEEPYINHLIEVAHLLAEAGADASVVAAGALHDVIEDTDVTADALAKAFGAKVSALVQEVTDDKSLSYAERKRRQIETAPHISAYAKMIKLADKTSNPRSLVASPPKQWDEARRREYARWSREVAVHCFGVNAALDRAFEDAYRAAAKQAGLEAA